MGRRHAVRRDGRGVRLVPSGYRLRHWPRARDERDSEAAGKGASCKLAAGAGHEVSAGVPRDPDCPRDAQTIAADQSGLRAITQTFWLSFARYSASWPSDARAARDLQDYGGVTRPSSGAGAGANAVQARRPPEARPPLAGRQPRRSAGKRRTRRDAHQGRILARPGHRNLRTTIVQQLMLPTGLFSAFVLSFCGLAATAGKDTTCRMYEC